MPAKKQKGVARRDRLPTKVYAAHAGERIRAVLHCLANDLGARKGLKATHPESTALSFPNTTRNVLEKALCTIKAAKQPKDYWTEATVGTALFPAGRQQESNHLLTVKEEQSLVDLIYAQAASSPPIYMSREKQRRAIRTTLAERRRRNKDAQGRYTVRPLSAAAQKVVDQPTNGGKLKFPTNPWFVDFDKRHKGPGGVWGKTRVTKDVKRMRSTDRLTLEADIEELVGDAVDLKITDEDGRWIEHPGADNDDKVGRGAGYCSKARTIQVDEKGEFIYYDRDKGGAARCKYSAPHGCQPLKAAQENRECFTYVPWADANGKFLFAQVIFKGAAPMEGHVSELAGSMVEGCILQQYTECGQQTDATFAAAVRCLRLVHNKVHGNHPIICNGEPLMITTDGHYSRKGVLTAKACKECNAEIQLRGAGKGGSSWLTQMWDMIFMKFHDSFVKITDAYTKSWEAKPGKDKHAVFTMSKRLIMTAVATMHYDGHAGWCTAADIVGAWATVGIGFFGISVKPLLANPAVSNVAPGKATQFKAVNTIPSFLDTPRVGAWKTPSKVRHNTLAYHEAKGKWSAARIKELEINPTNVMEAQAEDLRLTAYDEHIVNLAAHDYDRKGGARRQLKGVDPVGADVDMNTATGLINRSAAFCAKRKANADARCEASAGKERKVDSVLALRDQFVKCEAAETCTCGEGPCVRKTHFYCKDCFKAGRPCTQKSACGKRACPGRKDKAPSAKVLAAQALTAATPTAKGEVDPLAPGPPPGPPPGAPGLNR